MKNKIRTKEEFLASHRNWEAAQQFLNAIDDKDEIARAAKACEQEEARWDECRDLFEFDPDGNLIDLKKTP